MCLTKYTKITKFTYYENTHTSLIPFLICLHIVYNRRTIERGEIRLNEITVDKILLENKTETISTFGYELIREVLIHELLGDDASEILYWAGKKLANKFPMNSIEDITEFFQHASWGSLSLIKQTKNEMELELYSELIKERCEQNKHCIFQLEAGFIAQQIELQKGVICEAFEHPKKKRGKIQFTVKWDHKDTVNG